MKLEIAQQLVNGKRLDELVNEIWCMNPAQVNELADALFKFMNLKEDYDNEPYIELWDRIALRYDYFQKLRYAARRQLIVTTGGFEHDGRYFVPATYALESYQRVFGDKLVAVYQEYNDNELRDLTPVRETVNTAELDIEPHVTVVEFDDKRRIAFKCSEWGEIYLMK